MAIVIRHFFSHSPCMLCDLCGVNFWRCSLLGSKFGQLRNGISIASLLDHSWRYALVVNQWICHFSSDLILTEEVNIAKFFMALITFSLDRILTEKVIKACFSLWHALSYI